MNNRFFSELYRFKLEFMVEIIDWILDDEKFTYFKKEDISRITKKTKRISGLKKENYKYDSLKKLDFNVKIQKNKMLSYILMLMQRVET